MPFASILLLSESNLINNPFPFLTPPLAKWRLIFFSVFPPLSPQLPRKILFSSLFPPASSPSQKNLVCTNLCAVFLLICKVSGKYSLLSINHAKEKLFTHSPPPPMSSFLLRRNAILASATSAAALNSCSNATQLQAYQCRSIFGISGASFGPPPAAAAAAAPAAAPAHVDGSPSNASTKVTSIVNGAGGIGSIPATAMGGTQQIGPFTVIRDRSSQNFNQHASPAASYDSTSSGGIGQKKGRWDQYYGEQSAVAGDAAVTRAESHRFEW